MFNCLKFSFFGKIPSIQKNKNKESAINGKSLKG
jgi:hypothetical protein